MAIGGFSGTDPTPTLEQFKDDVARGDKSVLPIDEGARQRKAVLVRLHLDHL